MARDDDIREEVLNWAEESDEALLEYLGRKLADEGPLGFMGGGFSAPASFAQDARNWLNENTSRFVEEYNDNNGLGEVELAVSLADVLSSSFPAMPFGPLSLLVVRRIINRRSATYEAPEIEGVPEEEADPVSEKKSVDSTLGSIFLRADELAHANKGGNLSKGTLKKEQMTVRLDTEVVDWLKSKGPRHNARVNGLLRALMEHDDIEPS